MFQESECLVNDPHCSLSMVQTRQWPDGLELNSDHGMNDGQSECQTQILENSAIQVTPVQ